MKVLRKSGKVENLYYASTLLGLDKNMLEPKIPKTFMTTNKIDDWKIKRICFYPKVWQAISGMTGGKLENGLTIYIYSPLNLRNESLIKPGITQVPSSIVTDEYWYLAPIRLKLVGTITIESIDKTLDYRYGVRGLKGEIIKYRWKELLKSWEKPNLPMD